MKKYVEDSLYAVFKTIEDYLNHVDKNILISIRNDDINYFVNAFSIENILATGALTSEFFLRNASKLNDKDLLSLIHIYSTMRDSFSRSESNYHFKSKRIFPVHPEQVETEAAMCFEYVYDEMRVREGKERWHEIPPPDLTINSNDQLELFT